MLSRNRLAFTLTELLVAIAVLVGILLAVGKIFSTTSAVTRIGQAGAEVLSEIGAIEKQLRHDVERIDPEGFLMIRCVSVPNDVNDTTGAGAVLLDPALPANAVLRCDQLLFFAKGVEGVQTVRTGSSLMQRGEGASTRVYYGHGFQLGEASSPADPSGLVRAIDMDTDRILYPWFSSAVEGNIGMRSTQFETNNPAGSDMFDATGAGTVFVTPQDARRWPLVRQSVVLADDDFASPESNAKTVYLENGAVGTEGILCARSIFRRDPRPEFGGAWTTQLYDGRVDAAATRVPEIRSTLEEFDVDWPDQRDYLLDWKQGVLQYPRAERLAPSMHRVDQALTNSVLGTACSSLTIDWTWAQGVGASAPYPGFDVNGNTDDDYQDSSQPWFGLADAAREVYPMGDPPGAGYWVVPDTIWPDNIETFEYGIGPGGRVRVYEAVFGFNHADPLNYADPTIYGSVDPAEPDFEDAYTPWPSALRITMRLHDPDAQLRGGREVQFILALPSSVSEGVN